MESDEDRKENMLNTQEEDAEMDEQGNTINRLRNKQDHYDPDQDKNLKRSIRKGYRSLIDKAEEQSVDVSSVTAKQLTAEMMKANNLYDSVRAPQEATLDSRFLIVQSEMSAAKARAMKIDADCFDLDEFVNRLKSVGGGFNIDDEEEVDERTVRMDWGLISALALNHTRRIPGSDFMLGTIPEEAQKKTKRAAQRINKHNEEKTAPTEITEKDIQRAENETTTNVKKISELLEVFGGDNGINMFKFFINPDNFAQSVENLFYVSFLIRDGHASLSQDEETKEMILLACLGPTQEDYKQGLSKQQVVFELDMETWETAIEMYNITTTTIPTRDMESDITAFVILVVGLAITKPRVDSLESKWVNESNKGVYRGEVKGLRIVSKTLQKDSYDLVAFNVVVVERSAVYVGIFRQFFRLYGKVDIDVEVRVDEDEESNEESAQIRELEHKLSHEGSNKLEFQAQLNDLRQRKKTVDESNVELKNEIKQLSDELYRIGKHNKQSADTQLRLENETNSYTRQMDRYTTDIAANDAYTASVNLEDLDKELLSTTNSVNQLHADISSLSSQYNQLNDQLNASTSPNSPPLEFNLLPSQLLDDYE